MYLSRKSLLPLPLALVVGLFGTSTLTPVHVPGAPGGIAHPPVVQLATAERGMRRRRRIRAAVSVFGRAVRLMTRWRADRLDRPIFDLEAGRRHAPPRSRLTSETGQTSWRWLGVPNRPRAATRSNAR